jgi:small subunit ribosomal protein S1
VLRVGEVVKAQVLGIDSDKRQIKLSMKQLVPTDLDEYFEEHKVGDLVSGRVVEESGGVTMVELAEGVRATCRLKEPGSKDDEKSSAGAVDLSSLTSALQARWKGQTKSASANRDAVQAGQVRSFRISAMDEDSKKMELELA